MKTIKKTVFLSFFAIFSLIYMVLISNQVYSVGILEPIAMSSEDFTADDLVIDNDPDNTSVDRTNGYGLTMYFSGDTISSAGTDGFGFRLKNTTNTVLPIQTLYISLWDSVNKGAADNVEYSLMHSTVQFLWLDGTITTSVGGSVHRNVNIPANFDGIMVIDWSEVVTLKHPDFNGGNTGYTLRSDEFKLKKDGTSYYAYPTQDFLAIHMFMRPTAHTPAFGAANELIIGDPYTFVYGDKTTHTKYAGTSLKVHSENRPTGSKATWNNHPVQSSVVRYSVANYPTEVATYNLQVNGVAGYVDDSINLNTESDTVSVKFGYELEINPTLSADYGIGMIELDGTPLVDNHQVKNMSLTGTTHILNYITGPMYKVVVGENPEILLEDKTGISFDVNNTLGEEISYTLELKDSNGQIYTASNNGRGFLTVGEYTYWSDVFTIPKGFNGSIYIPFNQSQIRWSRVNNKPFDLEKPDKVINVIKLNHVLTDSINAAALESVLSNWKFETNAPELSSSPLDIIETEFTGGFATSLNEDVLIWSNVPRIYTIPQKTIPLGGLGLGLRVKNIGSNEIQFRINMEGTDGVVYSFAYPVTYTRVDNKTRESITDSQEYFNVPAGFDGTIILNLNNLSAGRLDVIGENGSSVAFQNVDIRNMNFYFNGTAEDLLLFNPTMITFGYDGIKKIYENVLLPTLPTSNMGDERIKEPIAITTNNLNITVDGMANDNSKISINQERLTLGDTLLVSSKVGYRIISLKFEDQIITPNSDGTYSIPIMQSYSEDLKLIVETAKACGYEFLFNNDAVSVQIENNLSQSGKVDEGSNITFTVNVLAGYELVEVKKNNEKINAVNGVYKVTIDSETTIEIINNTINYTITYHLDGGLNNTNPPTFTVEDTIIFTPLTKEGYNFDGWYKLDGNNQVDITGINKGTTGNIELYAKWALISYTITYNLDGGVNNTSNPLTYIPGEKIIFLAPTKDGYEFVGWYKLDGDNEVMISEIETNMTGNVEVYAKWKLATYTITYNLDGGSNNFNPTTYTQLDIIAFEPPTKAGYEFVGWYVMDGENEVEFTGIAAGTKNNLELYAKWRLATYTITYHLDGGVNAENPKTYTMEDSLILVDPTKDGYIFDGWYILDGNNKQNITKIEEGTTGNINLYAKWKEKTSQTNNIIIIISVLGGVILLSGAAGIVFILLKKKRV